MDVDEDDSDDEEDSEEEKEETPKKVYILSLSNTSFLLNFCLDKILFLTILFHMIC